MALQPALECWGLSHAARMLSSGGTSLHELAFVISGLEMKNRIEIEIMNTK